MEITSAIIPTKAVEIAVIPETAAEKTTKQIEANPTQERPVAKSA